MYVDKIKSYLSVLLEKDITKEQLRCLLATVNIRQLNGISQIIYNAYESNGFNLTKESYSKLRKHIKILNILCNTTKYSYTSRLSILRKHLTIIINILKILRPHIKKIIEDSHI
jgi:hypothetical protein